MHRRPFALVPPIALAAALVSNSISAADDLPAQKLAVPIDGAEVAYYEAGDPDGQPVVFVHGLPFSSYIWRDVVRALDGEAANAGHRLIAIDLVGFGDSTGTGYGVLEQAGHLGAFVDALGLDELVLVGHDWGAGIALTYAGANPDGVAGFATMEGAMPPVYPRPGYDEMPERIAGMFRSMRGPEAEANVLENDLWLDTIMPTMSAAPLPDAVVAEYHRPFPTPESRRPLLEMSRSLPIGWRARRRRRRLRARRRLVDIVQRTEARRVRRARQALRSGARRVERRERAERDTRERRARAAHAAGREPAGGRGRPGLVARGAGGPGRRGRRERRAERLRPERHDGRGPRNGALGYPPAPPTPFDMTVPATESAHVAVVDDDPDIRELVATHLERYGYRVTIADGARSLRALLARSRFDAILLDVMMPGEDGLALCRDLRASSDVPILFMTALSEETDRIVGLELGADDYIAKPFNPRELVARLKAVLRRAHALPPSAEVPSVERLGFAGRTFDLPRRAVTLPDGSRIGLSTSEFKVLKALVEHPGAVLTRDEIMDLTRGRSSDVFGRAVDSQISRLRRKLEDDPKRPAIILTHWGGGYCFSEEVEVLP